MSDVPEGYKMSEVGVIPEAWEVKRLGDAADVVMGQSPVGTSYNRSGNGAPLINGPTEFTEKYPVKIQWTSQPTKFCKEGDVLLCVRGSSTGRINISDDEYCIGRGVAAICAKSCADPSFITFQVDSPPLPEQQAIASALSDVDALIAALAQLITKKRNIKQGAMQQLLTGEKRLPGFGGAWEVKTLGDCLTKNPDYGINAPSVPYSDNLPVYIRITDISEDGRFLPEKITSVDNINSNNYFLEKDDLVFARTGASTGKTYLYNPKDGKLVFAGFLIRVKVNSQKLDPRFLKGYTETTMYWHWVNIMSMRSGQPGINGNEFSQLSIPLPPLPEQQAIAQILSDMDTEIEALEQKQAKYKAIKQGMMQELLTGKTRLV